MGPKMAKNYYPRAPPIIQSKGKVKVFARLINLDERSICSDSNCSFCRESSFRHESVSNTITKMVRFNEIDSIEDEEEKLYRNRI